MSEDAHAPSENDWKTGHGFCFQADELWRRSRPCMLSSYSVQSSLLPLNDVMSASGGRGALTGVGGGSMVRIE